jgi:hypothetical protein
MCDAEDSEAIMCSTSYCSLRGKLFSPGGCRGLTSCVLAAILDYECQTT